MGSLKINKFTIKGNEKIINGKVHWPDMLRISFSKYEAIQLMKLLINGIDTQENIDIVYFGKLHINIKEE